MFPVAVIREIHRLLHEGELSQRSIAEKLGVSRSLVGQVASGRRGLYGREALPRFARFENLSMYPQRCRGCGGMVYMPCRLCRTRRFTAVQRDRPGMLKYGERGRTPPRRVA